MCKRRNNISNIILSQHKGEFSKILVLVDGSQPSINAADRAIALAKKEKDNPQLLIALHVVFSRVGYAYSPEGVFGMDGLTTPNAMKEILENQIVPLLSTTRQREKYNQIYSEERMTEGHWAMLANR